MPVELETERLRLCQWREDHFEPLALFCADEDLCRYIGGTCDRHEAWREMAKFAGHFALRGFGMWALEEKSSGRFAGYAGLYFPTGWPEHEIGWGLLKEYHGRGYASEAALRARNYAYAELGWTTAVSYTHPDNKASQRVAERVGAKYEKTITLMPGKAAHVHRHPGPGVSFNLQSSKEKYSCQ
ncbi:GNAT family N-acetyltransferase [soil metagenome]